MEKRLQTVGGDTILDITETKSVKIRLSEKRLLIERAYYERSIEKFQERLALVNNKISQIENERNKN